MKNMVKILTAALLLAFGATTGARASDMNTPIGSRPTQIFLQNGNIKISVCYLAHYAAPFCLPEPQPETISLGQWCNELWDLPLPPGVTPAQFDQTPIGQLCFCVLTGGQCF